MPEKDSPLNLDDLPSMQAERREESSVPVVEDKAAVERKSSPLQGLLWLLVLLLVAAAVYVGFYIVQQQKTLVSAQVRIAALEARLSTTDESLSQSSVVQQVRLQELTNKTEELWEQMDKLWASAWRRNQSELTAQAKNVETIDKALKQVQQALAENEKMNKAQQQQQKDELAKLNLSLSALTTTQQKLQQQLADTQSFTQKIAQLEKQQKQAENN